MAIGVNESSKEVVSSGAKWTGIAKMNVSVINPGMEKLKAMGMSPQKEPQYLTKTDDIVDKDTQQVIEEGHDKYRLDIFLHNSEKKINAKLALWIEDKVRVNQNGDKVQWVNKFGQFGWGADAQTMPTVEFFRKDGARPALIGEEKLTKFIISWANCGPDDQAYLDNPQKLAKGDPSEILALLNAIPRNELQVLLGVISTTDKNGNPVTYQAVYDGYFAREKDKRWDAWKTALNNQYSAFKADYQNDYTLKEFIPAASQEMPTNMDQASGGKTASGVPKF